MEWKPATEKSTTLIEVLFQLKKALELERDKHKGKVHELQQMANSLMKKNGK